MKVKFSILLIVVLGLSACSGKPNAVVPVPTGMPPAAPKILQTVTPVCISSEPAQVDIDRALAFPGELFSAAEWVRSYTVADGHVSVSWSNEPLAVVAYVEAFIFSCGYEEPDIDKFFSDANWKIIFANYESYETGSSCKIDNGVRLYEFKAVAAGSTYNIRYWAKNDTDNRILGVMIVFPVKSQSLMDEYSARLFPTLKSCPK